MKENLETYLYIFFAVIYVISRIIKARSKKNQQEGQAAKPPQQVHPQQPRETPPQRKKAFSFDDILKEFEKNLAGETIQDQDEVEEIRHEKPTPIAIKEVEQKPNPYKNHKSPVRQSAKKGTVRAEPNFKRTENFDIQEKAVSPYVEMMRNPDGFKNAVVLSEIINTKYF